MKLFKIITLKRNQYKIVKKSFQLNLTLNEIKEFNVKLNLLFFLFFIVLKTFFILFFIPFLIEILIHFLFPKIMVF